MTGPVVRTKPNLFSGLVGLFGAHGPEIHEISVSSITEAATNNMFLGRLINLSIRIRARVEINTGSYNIIIGRR